MAKVKEIVVISGKGGTGKTSLLASFAALAENAVIADCDVDAADLHLVIEPDIQRTEDFSGGSRAEIIEEECTGCGRCAQLCRFGAIAEPQEAGGAYKVDPIGCEGCGVCARFCPTKAIRFEPALNGHCFVSNTRRGPMVHAKLGIAEENSGKLVTVVRTEARRIANEQNKDWILVDGSPGIGCPVIASITGANIVVAVTEPTLSGLHDLHRVTKLTEHFRIPTFVCINKWDLNPDVAHEIEELAKQRGATVAGRVRYDRVVTDAQIARRAVVEHTDNGVASEMRAVWKTVSAVT